MGKQLPVDANLHAYLKDGYNILDTRSPKQYLAGSLKHALFAPVSIVTHHSELILEALYHPAGRSIIISSEDPPNSAYDLLDAPYFIVGDYQNFQQAQLPTDIPIEVDTEEFILDYKHDKRIDVLDIRSQETYRQSHLKRSINIPFKEIPGAVPELSTASDLYIVGQDMDQVLFITSLLRFNGFLKARPVISPFSSLETSELTITRPKKYK